MDWLRWYDGTISDAKWSIVALKAKTNIGTVVSIWAALLEHASRQEDRGSLVGFDGETIDALFGYEMGTAAAVYEALKEKGLITEDDRIAAWNKRQFDEQGAERARRYRERQKAEKEQSRENNENNTTVTPPSRERHASVTQPSRTVTPDTDTDTDTDSDTERKDIVSLTGHVPISSKKPPLICPVEQIVKAYSDILPGLLPVQRITDARKKAVQARWREDKERQCLAWWNDYFERVRASDFLMGRCPPTQGRPTAWQADFDWLLKPANLQKVVEGKYDNHTRAAPQSFEDALKDYSDPFGLFTEEKKRLNDVAVEVTAEEEWV